VFRVFPPKNIFPVISEVEALSEGVADLFLSDLFDVCYNAFVQTNKDGKKGIIPLA